MPRMGSSYAHHSDGFWGCRFCSGRGCLACASESDKAYRAAFPEGPKPILTVNLYNTDADTAGQAQMLDDGCPNAEDPYVIHPDDASLLRPENIMNTISRLLAQEGR
jgi:hypothetical protein